MHKTLAKEKRRTVVCENSFASWTFFTWADLAAGEEVAARMQEEVVGHPRLAAWTGAGAMQEEQEEQEPELEEEEGHWECAASWQLH
jgi:hypothetical protein